MKKIIFILAVLGIAGAANAREWLESASAIAGPQVVQAENVASLQSVYIAPQEGEAKGVESVTGPFAKPDGYWGMESESVARSITFIPAGVKDEFDDRITYGTIMTMTLPNFNMDEDVITKLAINGNTAEIEFECGRFLDESDNKGKARVTYNPATKSMSIKVIKSPGGCWLEDCGPLKFQKAEQ